MSRLAHLVADHDVPGKGQGVLERRGCRRGSVRAAPRPPAPAASDRARASSTRSFSDSANAGTTKVRPPCQPSVLRPPGGSLTHRHVGFDEPRRLPDPGVPTGRRQQRCGLDRLQPSGSSRARRPAVAAEEHHVVRSAVHRGAAGRTVEGDQAQGHVRSFDESLHGWSQNGSGLLAADPSPPPPLRHAETGYSPRPREPASTSPPCRAPSDRCQTEHKLAFCSSVVPTKQAPAQAPPATGPVQVVARRLAVGEATVLGVDQGLVGLTSKAVANHPQRVVDDRDPAAKRGEPREGDVVQPGGRLDPPSAVPAAGLPPPPASAAAGRPCRVSAAPSSFRGWISSPARLIRWTPNSAMSAHGMVWSTGRSTWCSTGSRSVTHGCPVSVSDCGIPSTQPTTSKRDLTKGKNARKASSRRASRLRAGAFRMPFLNQLLSARAACARSTCSAPSGG